MLQNDAGVPVEERLFSLVLALLATEQGLAKAEILSTVQGYRQRYRPGGDNASLERQFERDKDDIRELGIPLETVEQPGEPGNNHTLRYRIPKGEYDLPRELTFTPEEIAMLSLAATVWRQGSMSRESHRALMKLRSLGVEPDASVIGYAPRVRTRDAAFEPLKNALDRRQVVTFTYLRAGGTTPRLRTVRPLALVQHQGRWLLYGHDENVDAARTFLLSRVVGGVHVTGRTFEVQESGSAERALRELDALWHAQQAVVYADAGSEAESRLAKRASSIAEDGALHIHYTDGALFADELAGFGPEVYVQAPDDLRDAVVARHALTVDAHPVHEQRTTTTGADDGRR
ncbi:WYL domain-containing protein [Okibacterium endophyticum]